MGKKKQPQVGDQIEPAKSGKSACYVCKETIPKDAIRIGTRRQRGSHSQIEWACVECFPTIKKNQAKDIQDISGYDNLTKQQQGDAAKAYNKAIKDQKQANQVVTPSAVAAPATKATTAAAKKAATAAAKKTATADTTATTSKTRGKSATDDSDQKKVKKPSGKYAGYTPGELKFFKENLEEMQEKSGAQLKALLKANGVTQSGNKDDLINRVADCKALGRLPTCSKCGGGKLKFNQSNGQYFCKGYMDDADFINCSAKFEKNEITREPWTD